MVKHNRARLGRSVQRCALPKGDRVGERKGVESNYEASVKSAVLMFLLVFLSGCVFRTPMVASPTGDGRYWILKQPLEYEQPRKRQTFIVPRGFVTDMASVPRLFWSVFPPCGRYTPAAVVHDYLYWYQPNTCQRRCADALLDVAMEESGVKELSRKAIYAAVRAGGGRAWQENKRLRGLGTIREVPEEFMDFGPYDTWKQIESRIRADANTNYQPQPLYYGSVRSLAR